MPEELNQQKNEEQYADFLKTIPPEIKNTLLSEDIKITIPAICLDNGIEDENKIEKIAYQATMVLLSRMSWEDFRAWLEKEFQIDKILAKKISEEMNEAIFSQETKETLPQENVIEKKPKPPESDIYKEPIE